MNITEFSKTSIKKQLAISLGSLMIGLAILKYVISIILVIAVTDNINSYAEDYVVDQIDRHSAALLKENSLLLVNYIDINARGVILPSAYSAENIYRSDFIAINDKTTSYFDWNYSTLAQPVEYDNRLKRMVSKVHSSFYMPYLYFSNLSNIPIDANQTVGDTNYLDKIWVSLIPKYTDFFELYIGTEDHGILRIYPGFNTSQNNRAFDPRVRPWYQLALSNPDQIVLTSPYDDAFLQGKVVTFAITYKNSANQTLGVAAGDLLLTTLVDSIQKIKIYKTGNIILMQTDKTIIVNKDGTTTFTDFIDVNSPFGSSSKFSNENYIYIYQRIENYKGIFILIAKVDSSEIQAPLETVRSNMQETKTNLILLLLGIFLAILALTIILLYLVVRNIVKPIERIMKISDNIINDIGRGPNKKGDDHSDLDDKISEIGILRDKIELLKVKLEEQKKEDLSKMFCENRYFQMTDEEIPWN